MGFKENKSSLVVRVLFCLFVCLSVALFGIVLWWLPTATKKNKQNRKARDEPEACRANFKVKCWYIFSKEKNTFKTYLGKLFDRTTYSNRLKSDDWTCVVWICPVCVKLDIFFCHDTSYFERWAGRELSASEGAWCWWCVWGQRQRSRRQVILADTLVGCEML